MPALRPTIPVLGLALGLAVALAAPLPATAQWWEDDAAFEAGTDDGLFTEYGYFDDYGLGGSMGLSAAYPAPEREMPAEPEMALSPGTLTYEQGQAAYYGTDFTEEENAGWFEPEG